MKVHELIEWLKAFHDQDADVLIVEHRSGTCYEEQGGTANEVEFSPEKHSEYIDRRGNPFVPDAAPYKDKRTLLLGALNS